MKRPFFVAEPPGNPLPPLWLASGMPLIGLGWLVPNHYYPWLAFHTDSWVAVGLAILAVVVWLRTPGSVAWHQITIVAAALMLLPGIQYAVGLLPLAGQAWIGVAYMAGLLWALLTGAQWERAREGQVADALFVAIVFAALVSAGLAMHQWLAIGGQDIWILSMGGSRAHANLAQPNQLATLLIWGILGIAWGMLRGKIRLHVAVPAVALLLFGVALTQSRTAWLSIILGLLAVWLWPPLARVSRLRWISLGFAAFFFLIAFSLNLMSDWLLLGFEQRSLEGSSSRLRFQAYLLFVDAIAQRPWAGYGWFRLSAAQFSLADQHPALEGFFLHSHNLFLDLILWCGIPIGLGVSIVILVWIVKSIRRVVNAHDAVLMMFVMAVGVHAMLELPLHYAYFLLPTGLILGMLNVRFKYLVILSTPRWSAAILGAGAIGMLFLIIHDYLKIEESFQAYRFEVARVGPQRVGRPPEVLMLTHVRDYIRLARMDVREGMTNAEVDWVRDVTYAFASPANLMKTAKAYALNGRREEAQQWINRMQRVMVARQFEDVKTLWENDASALPTMRGFSWPAPEK